MALVGIKKWWAVLLLVGVLVVVTYLNIEHETGFKVLTSPAEISDPLIKQKTTIKPKVEATVSPLVLLEWYKPFKKAHSDFILKSCGNCIYTQNRSKVMGTNTKAVVMHFHDINRETMPKNRQAGQLYVWFTMESTLTVSKLKLKDLDGLFNLTATHKRDSDIYVPYMTAYSAYRRVNSGLKPKTDAHLDKLIKQKTHVALWVVSNCATNKGAVERLKYAKQMIRDGLNLTFGGRCGGDTERKDYNYTKYKFYLAFENSWGCKDYITEKFWKNSLAAGTVPVVIGPPKADYEAVAPPNSFIFAQDFATPKKLVEYLEFLDKNDNAYKKYLVWTTLNISQMPGRRVQGFKCDLCKYMRELDDRQKNKSTPIMSSLSRTNFSLTNWLYENENKECLS